MINLKTRPERTVTLRVSLLVLLTRTTQKKEEEEEDDDNDNCNSYHIVVKLELQKFLYNSITLHTA